MLNPTLSRSTCNSLCKSMRKSISQESLMHEQSLFLQLEDALTEELDLIMKNDDSMSMSQT